MAITDYHRKVFDYLETYRTKYPEANLTYMLRQKNKAGRPRNQYLFSGDEHYISIGLYQPISNNNKTRSIYFLLLYNSSTDRIKSCCLSIVFGDSHLNTQQAIYQQILNQIGSDKFTSSGDRKYRLYYQDKDWQDSLFTYLTQHKPIIDRVLQEAGVFETFHIPENELEESIKVANQPVEESSAASITQDQPPARMTTTLAEPSTVHPKNIILYGPPGTGKTYETVDLAVDSIDGRKSPEHTVNKRRFDQLRKEGQIEFVTFHQNYTYEDFVMGLKPDVSAGSLLFEQREGIFYRLAKRARENYEDSLQTKPVISRFGFEKAFNKFIEPVKAGHEIKLQLDNGVNFRIADYQQKYQALWIKDAEQRERKYLSVITLGEIYRGIKGIHEEGPYYKSIVKAIQELGSFESVLEPVTPKNYVLIIDEINRANMSRVFGELITLLEEDKRLGADNELTITLPSGEPFAVPPNLYLIGTMNTADKSLALLDIALRRRFEFIGKYPDYKVINGPASGVLERLNRAILDHHKPADFLIGHAYFIGKSLNQLPAVFNNRVIPLLMEYFNGRTDLVMTVLKEAGIESERHPLTDQLSVSHVE